jgi:hypothetical protein
MGTKSSELCSIIKWARQSSYLPGYLIQAPKLNGSVKGNHGREHTVRPGLARLNPDCSLDTSFVPDPFLSVNTNGILRAVLQPEGDFLVAGTCQLPKPWLQTDLVRLTSDGTRDDSFHSTVLTNLVGLSSGTVFLPLQACSSLPTARS